MLHFSAYVIAWSTRVQCQHVIRKPGIHPKPPEISNQGNAELGKTTVRSSGADLASYLVLDLRMPSFALEDALQTG
jgi:hypothetical protein